MHRMQHSEFNLLREIQMEEIVNVVTTTSCKQPLMQQEGSSTKRFNEQNRDAETSL